jgi:glycosyltransferase involved in cell wall biosynthesis
VLIGIDASRATARERTGTENYTLYLLRALIARGQAHRFRLYFGQAPEQGLLPHDERVEWRVIPFPRLWTHLRLAWELGRHPPDVLFVPAHVLPLLHPKHCVVTVHDLGYRRYPQAHTRGSRWYLEWSTRHNVRAAERVIADSEATQRDLHEFYGVPAHKIVVAYPAGGEGFAPVRDETKLAQVRRRYGSGESYFLAVGTLQPRKNLPTLLTAFGSLVRDGALADGTRLVIAGRRGWLYEETIATVRALGLEGRVVFTGYVPQEDLPALLSGALAYVLPSWYEGFGLPVLEAMACETPVICSNVSSLPEVAGDAALLFAPDDPAALARAMRQVHAEPALRDELAARGRVRAQAFSWERCADQVLAVLDACK